VALRPVVVGTVVTAVFGVFWMIATGRFTMRASAITFYAGALTYPVYVIHQFFGAMLFEQLRMALGSVPLAMALVVAAVAALAWAIHVGVERPLGKRLRRLLDTPRLEARMSSAG
jgi:peptidoglycan/LPS O-acetylase OafA/YrhL